MIKIKNKNNDPSARPQTEFLCKQIRRIMEEKSMTTTHAGGIIGRGTIEKESLNGELSWEHIGASEKHWEVFGRHLGGIWEASGRLQEAPRDSRKAGGSRRLQTTKFDASLS